ncbi:MAG: alpha/beta hydrolase [Sulfitobacter sp.]|jgi:pimeloyl-ACP methyl ester carboxylesterase|nr:alpha/beta hydrolase [Roseobacter sp.]PHR08492.1 MAG: alpha/beta hydrolase [Sulfitobacter sp.]|tara:strand:+ start:8485 stop:9237 length:753 start_codon:yes stop_codon:yes gene_type:complete
MTATSYLDTPQGRKLAFHRVEGRGPCVVFLGGLKSDMMGTKAVFLEEWAVRTGHAFLRFDYSGHGESSGLFTDGCIGDWAEDTRAAVTALTDGPIIPVGSSMGGWQALLLSRAMPDAIAGLVTIAAAPDFTEDGYWASFTDAQKRTLVDEGQVELPSDYMEPYVITRRMIEDGRKQLVLRDTLSLPFPTRFLQGTADTAVSVATAVRLLEHAQGPDMQLQLVKDADHRFSDDRCLSLLSDALNQVIALAT